MQVNICAVLAGFSDLPDAHFFRATFKENLSLRLTFSFSFRFDVNGAYCEEEHLSYIFDPFTFSVQL
jgi:hypothetical protein